MAAYLNGEYTSVEDCHVSALDRGFLFGDAVYEVIAVYKKIPFELDRHLCRMERSLESSGIPNPHPRAEWRVIFETLINAETCENFGLYVQISRGASLRELSADSSLQPSVFAMTMPHTAPGTHTAKTIKAITANDPRWEHCDIKTTSLIANVMLRHKALAQNCDDTVMVRDGKVTEASAANVFAVCDNALYTAPQSPWILSGITRAVILDIAQQQKIAIKQQWFDKNLLYSADEIWLTSSTKEIVAVAELDGREIGKGAPYYWQNQFNLWLEHCTQLPARKENM